MAHLFNSTSLQKCRDRLSKAKEELQRCRGEGNFERFASHWAAFLLHTGSILNNLDAGSKMAPQARQWYGVQKAAGRRDPLVNYMHQARNAEEHESERSSEYKPSTLSINMRDNPDGFYIKNLHAQKMQQGYKLEGAGIQPVSRKPVTIRHSVGGPALAPVHNSRDKKTYKPPDEHQGKILRATDPVSVAELYLVYIEDLIAKAAEMA